MAKRYDLYWMHDDGSEELLGSYDEDRDVDREDIERDCWRELAAECRTVVQRIQCIEGRLVWVDTIHGDHVEGAPFLAFSDLSAEVLHPSHL